MPQPQTQKDILSLIKKIIAFQTTENNISEITACLKEFEGLFGDVLASTWYEFKGVPALVLSNTKEKEVDVIVYGHVDVVPAPKDLFKPVLKNSILYGRGARDMKSSDVASVYAVADYLKNGGKKKVAIFLTADEEISGFSAQQLLCKVGYTAKVALVPDGGDETSIVTKQKGFAQIAVTVVGKGSHASRPWEAENAIHKSIALDTHLKKAFPLPSASGWATTVVLTKIETENSINQIPEQAKASFDIRYVSKEDVDIVLNEAKKFLGKNVAITILGENGMFEIAKTNMYLVAVAKNMQEVHGKEASFLHTNGTSDAVFFSEKNIPVLLFQPKGGGEHESGEWVDMDSVYKLHDVVLAFLKRFPEEGNEKH